MGSTAGPYNPVKTKPRLYGFLNFFYLCQIFFSFSLTLPHFHCFFPPASPFVFVRGQEQKAWTPKMVLLLKTPRIMEKPLLWIFISSSHLSEENSTDVLVPCPPPWLYLERLRRNWCRFLNFGGRRGGERLQKGCSVVPGVVCSVWPHPSFVDGNLEDRLWCRSDTISICGSCVAWDVWTLGSSCIVRTVFPPLWTGCCYFGVITSTLPDLARFIGRNRNSRLVCGFLEIARAPPYLRICRTPNLEIKTGLIPVDTGIAAKSHPPALWCK